MNKALLVLASLAMSVGLANAAITYVSPCFVLEFANTSGNTGSTCSVTPDAGYYISSLTLTITDDYTGWQSGSPVVTYSGTLNESSLVFTGTTFCAVTTSGTNSVPCAAVILPAATVTGLNLPSFTIQLINAGNSVTGGAVSGASVVMAITAQETLITGSTPEPATFGLMGAALVGLGFLARKRKS